MNTTLKQVAQAAGVAQGTASLVLRGLGRAAPATRARVLAAARQLHYRPNRLVQGLQSGASHLVGVMIPTSGFYEPIFAGLHDALIDAGYAPICMRPRADQTGQPVGPSELEIVHHLIELRVDGIVMTPLHDLETDDYLHAVWEHGLPLVLVDREMPHVHADSVGTDDDAVGRLAAEHLLALGHQYLGHLAGPDYASTARRRRRSFEAAVRRGGARVRTIEDPSFTFGAAAARQLLTRTDKPTAIFAASDLQAGGIYEAAREAGLRIPDDLSVVGCADLPVAAWMDPPLTTLRQPARDIGQTAARVLLERITGADKAALHRLRLSPEWVLRGSTARCTSPRRTLSQRNTQETQHPEKEDNL